MSWRLDHLFSELGPVPVPPQELCEQGEPPLPFPALLFNQYLLLLSA